MARAAPTPPQVKTVLKRSKRGLRGEKSFSIFPALVENRASLPRANAEGCRRRSQRGNIDLRRFGSVGSCRCNPRGGVHAVETHECLNRNGRGRRDTSGLAQENSFIVIPLNPESGCTSQKKIISYSVEEHRRCQNNIYVTRRNVGKTD